MAFRPKENDRVIIRHAMARFHPVETTVSRVTPSGQQFYVDADEVQGTTLGRFASGRWSSSAAMVGNSDIMASPWTAESWREFVSQHEKRMEDEQQREREREQSIRDRETQYAQDAEAVESALGGTLDLALEPLDRPHGCHRLSSSLHPCWHKKAERVQMLVYPVVDFSLRAGERETRYRASCQWIVRSSQDSEEFRSGHFETNNHPTPRAAAVDALIYLLMR